MTLALTLLAAGCGIVSLLLPFIGADAAAHRHRKNGAAVTKERESKILELERALQTDYDDRDQRMNKGLVPDIRKDMETRQAMQKQLHDLRTETLTPEPWDEEAESRFLRRRWWAVVIAIVGIVLGYLAFLSGQKDQESEAKAAPHVVSLPQAVVIRLESVSPENLVRAWPLDHVL